jgi:hypothetical protein
MKYVTACDVNYYSKQGQFLALSLQKHAIRADDIHFFIVDTGENFTKLPAVKFHMHHIQTSEMFSRPGAKFLYATQVFKWCRMIGINEPLIYLDTDMIVRRDLSNIEKFLVSEKIDIAFKINEDIQKKGPTTETNGAKVNNGFVYLNSSVLAQRFIEKYELKIEQHINNGHEIVAMDDGIVTCIDQEFLYTELLSNSEVKFHNLSWRYNDSSFCIFSHIWHAKGIKKNHWMYLHETGKAHTSMIKRLVYMLRAEFRGLLVK